MAPPAELAARWQAELDRTVADLKARCIRGSDQLTIQAMGDFLSWQWFGEVGKPLPPSIILYEAYPRVWFRGRNTPLPNDGIRFLEEQLPPIINERRKFLEGRQEPICAALAAMVRDTPQYRFIASLAGPPRSEERVDVPLTQHEKNIRERSERERIARRHPAPPHGDLFTLNTAAKSELALARHRIEEATSWRRAEEKNAPFRRVNAWALREAENWQFGPRAG